ncbi:MAG: Mov34/MPN/PAD-1 family protein [Candidatus Odinarchaeota archaeon]
MKYEKDIILFVDNKIFEEIKQCVEQASPNEACGLVFGDIEESKNENNENEYSYYYNAYKFECIESSHKSPIAFLIDDYEELINLSRLYSNDFNYQLISIFHSHPASAYPSGIDIPYIESYYKSKISKFKHLIWSIMNAESKELNGFIFIFNELRQIQIQIKKK